MLWAVRPLLLMPAAFAGLAWISTSRHWFPGTQESGIGQLIEGMEEKVRVAPHSLLSPHIVVDKILLMPARTAIGR